MRWKPNCYTDKKVFRRTAANHKDINLRAKPLRGGIRL